MFYRWHTLFMAYYMFSEIICTLTKEYPVQQFNTITTSWKEMKLILNNPSDQMR